MFVNYLEWLYADISVVILLNSNNETALSASQAYSRKLLETYLWLANSFIKKIQGYPLLVFISDSFTPMLTARNL